MKKVLVLLLGCLMAFAGTGLAESSYAGTLEISETVSVTAPFAATVEDVLVEPGDSVSAGDALYQLATTGVYAPCDGTVRGILVEEGDRLGDAALFYAGALYIEPAAQFIINTNTDSYAGDNEDKLIHVGETVYLRRSSDSNRRTGEGVITAVSGEEYTVEVREGDVQLDDNCYIYRDSSYEYESRIGRGTIVRNNPVAISGEGIVLEMHVRDGQQVRKGDLLMETVSDLAWDSPAQVAAPVGGVVARVDVSVGSAVSQGQFTVELWPEQSLEAVLAVDEYDLNKFETGQRMRMTLDCDQTRSYEAIVQSISRLPEQNEEQTTYAVRLRFVNDDFVRAGMHVTLAEN